MTPVLKREHGGADGAQHLRPCPVERAQPLEGGRVRKRELVRKVSAFDALLRSLNLAQGGGVGGELVHVRLVCRLL